MPPWFWFFWAPQIHFPLSGAVSQQIEPDTRWFFDHIPESAGDPLIEARIAEVASYGRQLGLLTEALMGVVDEIPTLGAEANTAVARLRDIQRDVERIKLETRAGKGMALANEVLRLRQEGGEAWAAFSKAFTQSAALPSK